MKHKDSTFLIDIVVRYCLVFFAGLFNLYFFYLIFTPITYELLFFITKLFSNVILFSDGIMVNGVFFAIVSACIGGSAYYLLFILGMSTREIKLFKRIKLILFLFIILFVFNIFRMLFMIYIYGEVYFELIILVPPKHNLTITNFISKKQVLSLSGGSGVAKRAGLKIKFSNEKSCGLVPSGVRILPPTYLT